MPEYKVSGRRLTLTQVSATVRARGIEEARSKACMLAIEAPADFEDDHEVSSDVDVTHVQLSEKEKARGA